MIIFYNKNDGKILFYIEGRVHNQKTMKIEFDNGIGKENIGKFVIGLEEIDETEKFKEEIEVLEEIKEGASKGLFRKVKKIEIRERSKQIEHNMDVFKELQEIESISKISAFDYQIDLKSGKLVKKK